jgi:hypothetical protein
MECPICGRSDVFEDTTVWCDNCKEWVDIEDYHTTLEQENLRLREENEKLQSEIDFLHEQAAGASI